MHGEKNKKKTQRTRMQRHIRLCSSSTYTPVQNLSVIGPGCMTRKAVPEPPGLVTAPGVGGRRVGGESLQSHSVTCKRIKTERQTNRRAGASSRCVYLEASACKHLVDKCLRTWPKPARVLVFVSAASCAGTGEFLFLPPLLRRRCRLR